MERTARHILVATDLSPSTGPLFAVGSAVNAVAFLVSPLLARQHGLVRTVVTLQAMATFLLLGMAVRVRRDAARGPRARPCCAGCRSRSAA